jgi:hypothetical protein
MPKDTNTPAATVIAWLAQQLGPRALAPLTSTDTQAIKAGVELVRLWATVEDEQNNLAAAFAHVVMTMQPHCREFAFHSIAHVCDWTTRRELWTLAGLPRIDPVTTCRFE